MDQKVRQSLIALIVLSVLSTGATLIAYMIRSAKAQVSLSSMDQLLARQQKLLTIGGILWILPGVAIALAVWAVLTGRICFTCFNRGYLPVYRKSTQMFDIRMACPSCNET